MRCFLTRGRSYWFIPVCIALWAVVFGSSPSADAAQPPPAVEEVILVFKTHFDIGYTDLAKAVVARYRTRMIDQALEVCNRNRHLAPEQQFVWTLPGWPMSQILADWPGQTLDRQVRVEQALREGRFVVHGLPFTTHTELLEPEDLVRGLGFASRVARAVSLPLPRDAKMTDVPCHSWILPTMLRHAGIEFLHLGCNAASSSPQVPRLFWWEGPDGSRLLTMYVAEGYGTGLLPPGDWPYRTWLALIHTGDNQGPPPPEEVSQLLAEAQAKLPTARVRIGRLADFADAIQREAPALPVVRGDMPDSWIHGPMCNPQGAQAARTIRPLIGATESLHTLLRLWDVPAEETAPTIAAAYEQSLLYGEHTWGGALAWIAAYDRPGAMAYGDAWRVLRASGKYERLEASWAEHTAYIETAQRLIAPLLARQLQALAQSVSCAAERVVVFNPLPWQRDGLVTLAWPGPKPTGLRPVAGGEVVPVSVRDESITFVARDLPGLGYRTFVCAEPTEVVDAGDLECDAEQHTLASPYFQLVLDPERGTIRSLLDSRSGRQWVAQDASAGLGQYLYERFDRDQVAQYVRAYVKIDAAWALNELGKPDLPPATEVPYRASTPAGFSVSYQRSASEVSVTLASRGSVPSTPPHGVTTRVTLYRHLPCVDLEVTLHDKPADPWPEAGWICFPLQAASPRFRLGRLGSIVDPAHDLVPGSNHNLLAINTGLAVLDQSGDALGLCPLDSPLVSLGKPGCWTYDPVLVPDRAHVYVNLFNNQWTTNFRLWNEGSWTSRVRLWALDKNAVDQSLTVAALEARYPLLAARTTGDAGPLPVERDGVTLSKPGILLTAFGANPDGTGLMLRLWDLAGHDGPCTVRVPVHPALQQAHYADLRGQARPAEAAAPAADGQWSLPIHPYAPVTLVFP